MVGQEKWAGLCTNGPSVALRLTLDRVVSLAEGVSASHDLSGSKCDRIWNESFVSIVCLLFVVYEFLEGYTEVPKRCLGVSRFLLLE